MRKDFWQKLRRPILALAPMADVTDAAIRRIITKYGKPSVIWTEFVACDGLMSVGREKLLVDLKYSTRERPIVAQLFGSKPENFYECAKLMRKLKFDGIDINMGCPQKHVIGQNSGAALLRDLPLAREIIRETKRGAGDLPVSVKIRIGYSTNEIKKIMTELLKEKPAVITVHGRTKKEMSKVPADWKMIAEAAKIAEKDKSPDRTLIIGNGDVTDLKDALAKAKKYGVDGVMIGRAVFGRPWFFDPKTDENKIPLSKKLKIMLEHTKLFEKLLGEHKPFDLMKKHFKSYVSGFDGAKELRMELMGAKNSKEVEKIVQSYLKTIKK